MFNRSLKINLFPTMWPTIVGLIPARCHMWVEFVVGSPRVFRLFCGVSPSSKTTTWNEDPQEKPAEADVASPLNIVIPFFITNIKGV